MAKFKVGDRVKVTNRVRLKNKIFTISEVHEHLAFPYRLEGDIGGNLNAWNDTELELAEQNSRTYRLLKDTLSVRAGGLFQESDDDKYRLISPEFIKFGTGAVIDRGAVESQPEWFVEVFKVTPEYMTAEEREQWEAFKTPASKRAKQPSSDVVSSPRRGRGKRTPAATFVATYNASRNAASVAKKLGITTQSVYTRAANLRAQGWKLKKLKRSK